MGGISEFLQVPREGGCISKFWNKGGSEARNFSKSQGLHIIILREENFSKFRGWLRYQRVGRGGSGSSNFFKISDMYRGRGRNFLSSVECDFINGEESVFADFEMKGWRGRVPSRFETC